MYRGPLFRAALAHCEPRYDRVLIVSAFHDLLALDEVIQPYDRTMAGMSQHEREVWGDRVASSVVQRCQGLTSVDIFAGADYADPIYVGLYRRSVMAFRPLRGMTQGARLSWFKTAREAE
jgi:hypothetical protein